MKKKLKKVKSVKMPVTPRFTLSQTSEFVIAKVHVPYVRVSATELRISGRSLYLYCKPYLLKLRFPLPLVGCDEDERARAVYDMNDSNGTLTVYMPKATEGVHFEGLDMVTTLLQTSLPPKMVARLESGPLDAEGEYDNGDLEEEEGALDEETFGGGSASGSGATFGDAPPPRMRPLIEEIASLSLDDDSSSTAASPPAPPSFPSLSAAEREVVHGPGYGFADATRGFFARLRGSDSGVLAELIELPDPDRTPACARATLRRRAEEAAFDADRYVADTFCAASDDMVIDAARAYVAPWMTREAQRAAAGEQPWTQVETDDMIALPRHLGATHAALGVGRGTRREWSMGCGLLDILLAYCYDNRLTQGDPNVETTWTVCTLSPTLSWLHDYSAEEEGAEGEYGLPTEEEGLGLGPLSSASAAAVLHASTPAPFNAEARGRMVRSAVVGVARRILCFPYLRSWEMVRRTTGDVLGMLLCAAPRFAIVRTLLGVRRVVKRDESRYLLNKLYVDDYAVWAQGGGSSGAGLTDDLIVELGAALKEVFIALRKDEIGLSLVSVEADAMRATAAALSAVSASALAAEASTDSDDSSSSEEEEEKDDDDDDAATAADAPNAPLITVVASNDGNDDDDDGDAE